jgi:peptidyl-tRNA hydrolase
LISQPTDPIVHYVIVRDDPKIESVGQASAQIIHATNESCEGPLPEGSFAICLAARDEEHLLEIADRLWAAEIPHRVIYEPDAPFNDEATAIGIWPTRDRERIRAVTSDLPLYGRGWVRS